MACSDNVVRAGLTPKLKDVATLVSMLTYDCRPAEEQLFRPSCGSDDQRVQLFQPPVPDFSLAKIQVGNAVAAAAARECGTLMGPGIGWGEVGARNAPVELLV